MAENNEKTTNAADIETKSRAAYQLLREAIIDHSPASESLKDAINVLDLQFLGGNEQTGTPGFVQQVKGSIGSGMSRGSRQVLKGMSGITVCTRCNKEGPARDMVTWASVTGGSSHDLICLVCASELREDDRTYTLLEVLGNPFVKLVRTWRAGRAIAKRYDQCEKSFTSSLSEQERQDNDAYYTISFCILLGIMVAILVVLAIFLSGMKI